MSDEMIAAVIKGRATAHGMPAASLTGVCGSIKAGNTAHGACGFSKFFQGRRAASTTLMYRTGADFLVPRMPVGHGLAPSGNPMANG